MWLYRIVVILSILHISHGADLDAIENLRKSLDIRNIQGLGKCAEVIKKGFEAKASWLLYMFDASAKLQSGILQGNIYNLGSFDECLAIDVPKDEIHGKYCLGSATIDLEKMLNMTMEETMSGSSAMTLYFGLCLPDVCSGDELGDLLPGVLSFAESSCQTQSTQPTLTTGDILAITFFAVIIAIILASTAYDVYLDQNDLKPASILLLAFSFLSNGRKLFKVSNDPNQIQCINGIRSISIMWVVLGHIFLSRAMMPATNSLDLFTWFLSADAMHVVGATVSVDTFFVLSGMVMVYSFLKLKPEGGFFNIFMYYLHRYIRLTPSLAVLLLIHVTLLDHMASGPMWPSAKTSLIDYCVEYWWTPLLYIQNFVNNTKFCMGVTWYLSIDMQLFILSPLILIPIKKFTKTTFSLVILLAFGSIGAGFYVGWKYHFNGLLNQNLDYHAKYYTATHTRAAPWLFGTIAGYFMYEIKCAGRKFKPNKILVCALWIISLAVMAACVFGGHNLLKEDYTNRALNSSYIAFARPAWSIAIIWVVIACTTGYGGPINAFLSFWPFQIIAKISYSVYLLHLSILLLFADSTRSSLEFSPLWDTYFFWGHFTVICAISTLWTLAFESPIIVLEKYLRGSGEKKVEKEERGIVSVTELAKKV